MVMFSCFTTYWEFYGKTKTSYTLPTLYFMAKVYLFNISDFYISKNYKRYLLALIKKFDKAEVQNLLHTTYRLTFT